MEALTLVQAAQFLKMHPEEVRRRAKRGDLPGAKAGRAWVFIENDLADYVRSFEWEWIERVPKGSSTGNRGGGYAG
jgi:hypothetical protein